MNRSNSNSHLPASSHLSDDELIRRLYGIGEEQDHLAACPECGERWRAIQNVIRSARAESPRGVEVSGRVLAAQRQQVLERADRSAAAATWRWVPAAAGASLLAVALFVARPYEARKPRPAPAAATAAMSAEAEAQLFNDVYSMEQEVEPQAAAPIRALFQETSFETEAPTQ
jgi:hypothetical protein